MPIRRGTKAKTSFLDDDGHFLRGALSCGWRCSQPLMLAITVLSAWARSRAGTPPGGWCSFLLGPISITRIDAVAAALAIIAAAVLATHPRITVILLTGATWVKVWPVTMVASLVIMLRHRVRTMAWFMLASVAIVCVPVAFGAAHDS